MALREERVVFWGGGSALHREDGADVSKGRQERKEREFGNSKRLMYIQGNV